MKYLSLYHIFLLFSHTIPNIKAAADQLNTKCLPGTKKDENGQCLELENIDVMRAMHKLANPPTTTCTNIHSFIYK